MPNIGGVSTNVSILAKGFVAAGHDVCVVSLSPGPTDGYGHKVVRRPMPWVLFKLYRDADLLILSNLAIKLIYPLLVLRRPFALRHHSESAFRLSNSPFSIDVLRRAVLPRAKHFMTSAYIGRKSGFAEFSITHPFANPHHITADVIASIEARRDAVFVGRLEPEKGILWLLDHWRYIRQILGVDQLRVIGNGSLTEEVARRVVSGSAPHVVHVGHLQRAETAREMGHAAYSIVPSLWEEPFGAVGLESLAAGAVVVHTDRGGLPETTGGMGISFDPDDQESCDAAFLKARALYEQRLSSPEFEKKYLSDVSAFTSKFRPEVVVQKIISVMGADGQG
ncbi:MAG: glycosyltransferase [Parvibaculum sp.]|nr:glycosyltransferase [Parvibaculum sp.]